MDGAKIRAARGRADLAGRDGRAGGDSGLEPVVPGAGPGGGQPIRPSRGVRFDRARRNHESVGDRARRTVAGRGADVGPHVSRQRNGRVAGLRIRAGTAAGAVVLLLRPDCLGIGMAGIRPSAAGRWASPAIAAIGAQGGAIRPARRGPIPLLQRRGCGVLRRAGGPGGRFAQCVRAARIRGADRSGPRRHGHLFEGGAQWRALGDLVQRPPL